MPDEWWGPLGGLGGRPRHLGRDRRRSPRGRHRREAGGCERDGSSSTPPLPACWSPRRSDASATGGTRSSSASRPAAPGASRSTPRAARTTTSSTRPSTRRSSTRALWCLAAAGLLILLDRRYTFRPPALFALYVALYTGFRFYLETLRIDPSEEIAGWRVNAWVSAILFVASVAFFIWWQLFRGRRRRSRREPKAEPPPTMAVPRGRVRPRS